MNSNSYNNKVIMYKEFLLANKRWKKLFGKVLRKKIVGIEKAFFKKIKRDPWQARRQTEREVEYRKKKKKKLLMIIKRRWGSRINRWDPYHVKRILFNKNCRCKIILNNSSVHFHSTSSFHFLSFVHLKIYLSFSVDTRHEQHWEKQEAMSWNGNFYYYKKFRMLIGILQRFPSNFISFYLLSVCLY